MVLHWGVCFVATITDSCAFLYRYHSKKHYGITYCSYLFWNYTFKSYNLDRHLQKVKDYIYIYILFCQFRKILEAALQHAAMHTLYN